jgi:glucose/arabinose dehydrogenase
MKFGYSILPSRWNFRHRSAPVLSKKFELLAALSRQSKLFLTYVVILISACIIAVIVTHVDVANAAPSHVTYGCLKVTQSLQCDPMTNKFKSISVTGHVQRISTINSTKVDLVEGVFGNALAIYGYRQQYLTVPNQYVINPAVFSVSFWVKLDAGFLSNSSVFSHVNLEKKAGWYVEAYVRNFQTFIQFSVANSDGKIFSASSPIDPEIFQNVVGVFDGNSVKIYLNGFLLDSTAFAGDYDPDPGVPLNIGLSSFDYGRPWNGAIDEVRLYEEAISDDDIQTLTDYSTYKIQSSSSHSKDDRLIAYWPFQEGAINMSGKQIDSKLILPAASMIFSPDGRLFFSVMDAGEIRIMNKDLTPLEEPFIRLQDDSTNASEDILGITLDPDFSSNHYVYAFVTAGEGDIANKFSRVIRFTETENKATDQKVLVHHIPAVAKGRQFAGALAFGPDMKLYITTAYTSLVEPSQNSSLAGKVLRINKDGTIPSDNPVSNSPVYTTGHRNMLGIAFDKATGMAIAAENGAKHHDEINVLEKGGNYGYPANRQKEQSSPSSWAQTDNSSSIPPARTYYKTITPTQMIFYDDNRFRGLKDMFLVTSYGEGSIYALSLNKTGHLLEEVAIRLPEVRGHINSIAKAPNGDIYIAGENMYKLISIDDNQPTLTYFIDTVSNNNGIQIDKMFLNLTSKVLSLDISNTNANTNITDNNGNTSAISAPSLRLTIPKTLLGIISEVTSEDYNMTASPNEKTVENFKTKETRRVTNVGDTIIDIQLKDNFATDKILIKGYSSTLIKPPTRNVQIQR